MKTIEDDDGDQLPASDQTLLNLMCCSIECCSTNEHMLEPYVLRNSEYDSYAKKTKPFLGGLMQPRRALIQLRSGVRLIQLPWLRWNATTNPHNALRCLDAFIDARGSGRSLMPNAPLCMPVCVMIPVRLGCRSPSIRLAHHVCPHCDILSRV